MSRWAYSALGAVLFGLAAALLLSSMGHAQVPREALRYQRTLTGQARAVWGLEAPIATFAAQVHQESGWRPDAHSRYAAGLAQFTPATADWIGGAYPELANPDVYNPAWALQALVRYDRWLWERVAVPDGCDRMAFALAAYNGGAGWIDRERRTAGRNGRNPAKWWGEVEKVCVRGPEACVENRGYPVRILRVLEPKYVTWGARSCG